jgi:hypothetical protein
MMKVIPSSIRLYFYKIIYNEYKDMNMRDFFNLPNIPNETTNREQYIKFIIKLYEGQETSYYRIINRCLR